ncbi:stage V sporulation protein AB [Oceanobacillus manasiensis]|uniref:stage V sporulation protein AB n=1 Tax=Oceanobacillus manasiensis TaxID=586413 RepID=UPI0005A9278F|nr:stage V sporulation protein AB [Oceanobacillus manasiensis]
MIVNLLTNLLQVIIGISSGMAVGGGFVAFLTVLGVIPRLIQLSKTGRMLKVYIGCVIAGSMFGTYLSFSSVNLEQPLVFIVIWGLFHGIFNGMLAAALTEVLNVFPILSKRIGLEGYLLWMLMAIVFGKVAGSLFQWIYFVK